MAPESQQPGIDRKSLKDTDVFDPNAIKGKQRDINNLREAAQKGYLDGKVDQSVIDGLLSNQSGAAAAIAGLLGMLGPFGALAADFDPHAKAKNLDLSEEGIDARTAALMGLLNNESQMSQIQDQLELDKPDGQDIYGATSASTKAVKAQMQDYPKQWFPPGANYNEDLFRNDDGSVKSDAQIDELLRQMWRNHAQGKGTTSGSNKIFGTNIDVGSLGPGVSSTLRTLYEGGDYDRYRALIDAIGGETNLAAPWSPGQGYLPGPEWAATDMAEQYVDVNPGLAAAWELIDAVQKGEDTSRFPDFNGLSPEQQTEYWHKEAGDNNLTKEEFGQAHLAYTGSKYNPVPSGEHSISRNRRIFEWQQPESESKPSAKKAAPVAAPVAAPENVVEETTGPTVQDVNEMTPIPLPAMTITPSGSPGGDVSPEEGAASEGFKSALANLGPSGLPSGVSYLVPVKDRWTGKIRYVPQGSASYYSNWSGVGSGIPGVTMTPGYGWGRGRSTLPGTPTGRRATWGSTVTV
ncbi:MAG: hypothetical protein QGH15_21290 [Kiritimatiellia bacterium]|nr:hypothetical protein [Kiritimatiellia bacterium]